MNKKYIPLLIAMLFIGLMAGNAFGQKKQQQKMVVIESVVVNESGTPVPNATIFGKEGAVEVLSDSEGKFSIEVPENTRLLIEAQGYDPQVITLSEVPAKVTMKQVEFLMDESSKVNIAFGTVKQREIVGAVSSVNTKDILKYDNTWSFFDAIRSRLPGMLGSSIRGVGGAVFIVDGFPRDIADLNVEEIEQITILKDANSAALWGVQAKNGVIIITTKRGQAYKRKINVSVEQGLSNPVVLPKYLGSADYMGLYNEALANDGLAPAFADSIIDKYASGANPYRYPSTDYYSSEYLKNNRSMTKVMTEFSGGNEITRYYAIVGWMRAGSLYGIGTGDNARANRFNVRGNVDFKVNDYISAFVDALVTIQGDKGPRGSFWTAAATLHPEYYSPLVPVDRIAHNATMTGGADLGTAEIVNGNYILGGTSQYRDNVYGNMLFAGYNQNIFRTARFGAGVNVDLKKVTEGLKLKTYLSLDVFNGYVQSVTNDYAVYQPTWASFGSTDSIVSLNKIGTDVNRPAQNLGFGGYFRRIGTYATLDYNRTFNNVHSVTGTMLAYFDTYTTNDVVVDRKNSHLGLRLTYDYQKKIFVDFSSAYVNGFKLEKGSKGSLSPTLGVAWVLRDQQSVQDLGKFNYLKLRASAGIINYEFDGSNYRLYESTFGSSGSYGWYDGSRSVSRTLISRAANPNLTFQKMKSINIGMEGYFFNNMVYLDANLFANRNSGQVIQRSIYAPYVGTMIPWENYNITDYKGAEAGIRLSKDIGDFYIMAGANFLIASSNVKRRDEQLWANAYQYRQGKPSDAIFGLEALGLFQTQAEIDASPEQKFGTVKPGDVKYMDQNDDGKIDQDDEVQIGNGIPNFSYSLTFTLKYKALSLFAIGNGRNGAEDFYNGAYFWVQGTDKYSEEVLGRWTPSTASSATYPRLSSQSSPNNFRNSTYWIYKDNYFNLDRVQLNFELPKNIISKISSKELTVYLRGENLARISKDAEKRQLRIGMEPNYRSYALGLRILF